MADTVSFSVWDYDDEQASFTVNIVDVNAGNFAAQNTAAVAFRVAAQGLMDTTVLIGKDTLHNVIQDIGHAIPSSPLAQREIKWLVTGINPLTGRLYNIEIPCARLSYLENHSKYLFRGGTVVVSDVDTVAAIGAFETAYEAFAKTPDGAALELYEIKQVGRNL